MALAPAGAVAPRATAYSRVGYIVRITLKALATAAAHPSVPTLVTVSIMNSAVHSILYVTFDDIKMKISHPSLTKIEGKLNYSSMRILCK